MYTKACILEKLIIIISQRILNRECQSQLHHHQLVAKVDIRATTGPNVDNVEEVSNISTLRT